MIQLYSDMLINCYMPIIDDIYDSNKQHQPKSRIQTENENHGKNEHELLVLKPKTNLNSDIQESPNELTPKETATLQTENEQLKYTDFLITYNTTASIPNERPKHIH